MKRLIIVLFVFVMLFQSTSTLFILGSFYMNRDYIAENMCINRFDSLPICMGQCYLNNQLEKNEKQQQNFPDLKQKEIQLFCQSVNSIKLSANFEIAKSHNNSIKQTLIPSDFLFTIFHPPQTV